jgi:dTMP kinase
MFIVFEGIDGSGKTTLSNQVASALQTRGLPVRHIRADGKYASRVSEAIRELGRDARNLQLVPEAEMLLYVARDVQLIEQVVRPALRDGDIVIADRFLYTAEVLARQGRHLPATYTDPILAAAARGLVPDLVVLCDVDPALARARRRAAKLAAADRRPPARKGLAGVGLQHRIRRGYLALAAAAPERWVVVDNDAPLDQVVAAVTDLIDGVRAGGVQASLDRFRRDAGARLGAGGSPRPSRPSGPSTLAEALELFLCRVDRYAEREPNVAAHLLGGLAGPAVDERRRSLATRVPEAVLAGLAGQDDEVSWELREWLWEQKPRATALTLLGLPAENGRAASMRAALADLAPTEVATSLQGLDGEEANGLRERLFRHSPEAVVTSLARLVSQAAWSLREQWLAWHREELASRYEIALVAALSVTGLRDDRAWRLREAARTAAPVAALASLAGVLGDMAWRWREESLGHAPKIVMQTLVGVEDERASRMRAAVVADCKEALDSIVALDGPRAWSLRETYADVWPSTAVKSLGPLADGTRGRTLIARQLAAHPDSLSLLKHVSAVALGVHRLKSAPGN